MLFFLLITVKMPTNVGILIIMRRKIFMLSWVEHGKNFITVWLSLSRYLIPKCGHCPSISDLEGQENMNC